MDDRHPFPVGSWAHCTIGTTVFTVRITGHDATDNWYPYQITVFGGTERWCSQAAHHELAPYTPTDEEVATWTIALLSE